MTEDQKSAEMPFLEHLEELRTRLLWSVGALLLCMLVSMIVVFDPDRNVIGFLATPVLPFLQGNKLIYTHPADTATISLKVAFGCGLVLATPVIGYQLWAFLSPALHRHEKKLVVPVLLGATILFASGVIIAWVWMLPLMLKMLFGIQSAALTPMISAGEYFSFMITICLAFGAIAQVPLIILALTALGLVTPRMLSRFRRHAMVASILVSALVTPGDVLSMTILMAGPLYALYEVSIIVSWVTYRLKQRSAKKAEPSIGGAAA